MGKLCYEHGGAWGRCLMEQRVKYWRTGLVSLSRHASAVSRGLATLGSYCYKWQSRVMTHRAGEEVVRKRGNVSPYLFLNSK